MITILCIGKKHEEWVLDGIERYEKRLKQPFDVEWILLPHSSLWGEQARSEESERILSKIEPRSYVVLLDEIGQRLGSPDFASLLESKFTEGKKIVAVIGGAYGVNDSLKARANVTLSLSDMVFPHQLVRLILTEQLYRAQEISRGGKYHHE